MRSDLVARINLDNLAHNFRALRACCGPKVRLCAPLKADAYGHGLEIVAPALQAAGADYACVATVREGVRLREIGWRPPILVLGNVLAVRDAEERADRFRAVCEHDLMLTVADDTVIRAAAASGTRTPIDVHIKIDTGMGRMGVLPDEAAALVRQAHNCPHLRIRGIYSHFAAADFQQMDLVRRQLTAFQDVLSRVENDLPPAALRHMANSAATIALPQAHFDMVRPGLALYGYWPAIHLRSRIDLRPALRLVAHLTAVKNLPAGHCVGYGQTFITARPTRLGIVPAGYFDGYLRSLSNAGIVTADGVELPVIGRVSMDQLAVDLTDHSGLRVGDEITLIEDRPDAPNSVQALADKLGTIPYEVTCLLGPRIDREAATSGISPQRNRARGERTVDHSA